MERQWSSQLKNKIWEAKKNIKGMGRRDGRTDGGRERRQLVVLIVLMTGYFDGALSGCFAEDHLGPKTGPTARS